jgi:hypothetical protein
MGRSLWREDGSVLYNCCWPSPALSFSGPSPVRLVTIFYCLTFETPLFVASYDSKGYGGGIRPCLHTDTLSSCLADSSCFINFGRPRTENLIQRFIFSICCICLLMYALSRELVYNRQRCIRCYLLSRKLVFVNICCRGNMITELLSSNGHLAHLFRLLGGVYRAVAWQWTPGSDSTIVAFRRHVTIFMDGISWNWVFDFASWLLYSRGKGPRSHLLGDLSTFGDCSCQYRITIRYDTGWATKTWTLCGEKFSFPLSRITPRFIGRKPYKLVIIPSYLSRLA